MSYEITPERDASLGLVFRLNYLWAQADFAALGGKYDLWNNILDRIYCNLLYNEEMEIEESNGEITSIKLSKKDIRVYTFVSKKIHEAKSNYFRAGRGNQNLMRSRWYHAIQKKDIWLRKLMQNRKLYLKENKRTPGRAMFGDFGGRG